MVRTPGVQPWNQCRKSCFIIIWQLLAPFSSQPLVHKWAGSTTGWVLLWNGDSGADTWCPVMEQNSQIMFYNHLDTFRSMVNLVQGPQVGWFAQNISMFIYFRRTLGPYINVLVYYKNKQYRPLLNCTQLH